jgi:hypothetical protein
MLTNYHLLIFCDSLIREKDKLLHLGVINTAGTSNKALMDQQKDKSKHLKKQYPWNNNKNKGPNPLNQRLLPMVIKDQNQEVRRLRDIVIFVGEIVI